MHKNIRLAPLDRREFWQLHQINLFKQKDLAVKFRVSMKTYLQIGSEYLLIIVKKM